MKDPGRLQQFFLDTGYGDDSYRLLLGGRIDGYWYHEPTGTVNHQRLLDDAVYGLGETYLRSVVSEATFAND